MSDKMQFQTNIPVEIALKYGDGKEVSGQYGDLRDGDSIEGHL
jgi:hypothetical protein